MKDRIYYIPDFKKLQEKYNVKENLIHLSGSSSDTLSSVIQSYGSDMAKVVPGGRGGHAAPVSMSALCLSPVQHTIFQKK